MAQTQSGTGTIESAPLHAPGEMDIRQNRQTYDLFLKLTKWGLIHIIVILVLLAIFVV